MRLRALLVAAALALCAAPAIGATYTPANIAGCVLWLDASDTSTQTIATGVSQWNDKCSTNNVTQPTGAKQPTQGTVNGRTALVFDGTQQWMTKAASTLPVGVSPDFTVFIVAGYAADATNRVMLKWGVDAGEAQVDLGQSDNTTAYFYDGSVSWTSAILGYSTAHLLEWQSAAGSVMLWQDGTAETPTGGSTPTIAAAPPIFVGSFNGSQQFWKTTIEEIIVYNSAISAADRQTIEGYLCWKWGFNATCPGTGPYVNGPPYGWLWSFGLSPAYGVYPGGIVW